MNELQRQYAFPLCIQLTVRDSICDPEFLETLQLLQSHGFYGVELNALDFKRLPPSELRNLLDSYELRLTMVASGAHAQQHGLSLSHEDEAIRLKSVEDLKGMIDFAGQIDAGVVCGFIKGDSRGSFPTCQSQMIKSLEELDRSGYLKKAPLYIEATNHYEALLANTLDEASAFGAHTEGPVHILPDTYHMNIEEKNIYSALQKHQGLYQNVHFSDNNRYYPGFGAMDFLGILRFLKAIDYKGTVSFEGRNYGTLASDIEHSARYLKALSEMV